MTPKRFQATGTPFSHLGVPTQAGMSDWYESMSWTPIRDRLPCRESGSQTRLSSDRKHAPYPDTGLESRRGGVGRD